MPSTTVLFTLKTALGAALRLRSLSGVEEMGRLFEYQVLALADGNEQVDLDGLLGTKASVAVELPAGGEPRHFHGIVAACGLDGGSGRLAGYRLTLRPWLWLATRRIDTRIFQQKSAVDVIKAVFEPYTGDFEFDTTGGKTAIEYCVQYRETDFDFVSRLMEQEGLYYFFRHSADKHTLVITDKMSAHVAYPGHGRIVFRESLDHLLDVEGVTEWRTRREIQPGKVTLTDFNFVTPKTSLLKSKASTIPKAKPAYEVYDPPGKYEVAGDGERYAGLRMQEFEARHARAAGSGSARSIASGYRFTLTEHPRSSEDGEYVVVSTHIEAVYSGYESGQGESRYTCRFEAMRGSDIFRPARITPKPVVGGPQTAIVVGKSGDEITTDEHGRVKVQFHWDRLGKNDETSSCWVRVSHPWAGKGWGMIALPRIGQEVVVDFLEGDPDRPIITGRVYNGENKPPYALPDNATVSTARSRSSKGGGDKDFNELRFEDNKGKEYIWFQAQKDYYQHVKNDSFTLIDHDQFRIVKKNLNDEIKENVQLLVGKDRKTQVKGKDQLSVDGDRLVQVQGKQDTKASADLVFESGAVISLKSGADTHAKVGANLGVDASANVHIKGGANVVIEAGAMLTLKCGGSSIVLGPTLSITGSMVLINSGGAAGAGTGANPKTPTAPEKPEPPKEPKDPLA
ncbi:MAG TPA: type VI secretion system tip protein TssI/VgrG [Burkholderiaceae bacterium]|nr:type VI secretion system tip protein TssI/VgrG [Burkholderiaceae bacterium]